MIVGILSWCPSRLAIALGVLHTQGGRVDDRGNAKNGDDISAEHFVSLAKGARMVSRALSWVHMNLHTLISERQGCVMHLEWTPGWDVA